MAIVIVVVAGVVATLVPYTPVAEATPPAEFVLADQPSCASVLSRLVAVDRCVIEVNAAIDVLASSVPALRSAVALVQVQTATESVLAPVEIVERREVGVVPPESASCPVWSVEQVFDDPMGDWDGDSLTNVHELYNSSDPCTPDPIDTPPVVAPEPAAVAVTPAMPQPGIEPPAAAASSPATTTNASQPPAVADSTAEVAGPATAPGNPCPAYGVNDVFTDQFSDWDGDGRSNIDEFDAFTDPCDADSASETSTARPAASDLEICPSYSDQDIYAAPDGDWDGDGRSNLDEFYNVGDPCSFDEGSVVSGAPAPAVGPCPEFSLDAVLADPETDWDGDGRSNIDEFYNVGDPCSFDEGSVVSGAPAPAVGPCPEFSLDAVLADPETDWDGDGQSNISEFYDTSDPCTAEIDTPDGPAAPAPAGPSCPDWESKDVFAQSAEDWDGDGIANLDELLRNTNPCDPTNTGPARPSAEDSEDPKDEDPAGTPADVGAPVAGELEPEPDDVASVVIPTESESTESPAPTTATTLSETTIDTSAATSVESEEPASGALAAVDAPDPTSAAWTVAAGVASANIAGAASLSFSAGSFHLAHGGVVEQIDAAGITQLNILGSADNDALALDASIAAAGIGIPIDFAAGSGEDTLIGPSPDTTWSVTGRGAGFVAGATFTDVEHLVGSANNEDTFVIEAGGYVASVDGNTAGFDTIVVKETTVAARYEVRGPDAGVVTLNTGTLTYAGLEPVVIDGSQDFVLATTAGDDTVTASAHTTETNRLILDAPTMELHDLETPTDSLTIDLGDGDDTLIINADVLARLEAALATLTILGGDGHDTISLDADIAGTWEVTALNSGTWYEGLDFATDVAERTGRTFSFDSVETLIGAVSAVDRVSYTPTSALTGAFDPRGGKTVVSIGDFVHYAGDLTTTSGSVTDITIETGLPVNGNGLPALAPWVDALDDLVGAATGPALSTDWTTLTGVDAATSTMSISNGAVFVGYNPNWSLDGTGELDFTEPVGVPASVGMFAEGVDVGMVVLTPTNLTALGMRRLVFTGLSAHIESAGLTGGDILEASVHDVTVNVNTGRSWPSGYGVPVVDFETSFPALGGDPAGLNIPTGSDPVLIDFDGSRRVGFSAERVLLSISDVVHITGSLAYEHGGTETVTVATSLPANVVELGGVDTVAQFAIDSINDLLGFVGTGTSVSSDFSTISGLKVAVAKLGVGNASMFVGYNPGWGGNVVTDANGDIFFASDTDQDGIIDASELHTTAVGLLASDVDFGLVKMTPKLASLTSANWFPTFAALKLTADTVALVGVPDIEVELNGIEIVMNNGGTFKPEGAGGVISIGAPVVDFATSFPGTPPAPDTDLTDCSAPVADPAIADPLGYEVETGSDSVFLDFDGNQRIAVKVRCAKIQLSAFAHIFGRLAFEVGPRHRVDINTGLPATARSDIQTLAGLEALAPLLGLREVADGEDPGDTLGVQHDLSYIYNVEVASLVVGASDLSLFLGYAPVELDRGADNVFGLDDFVGASAPDGNKKAVGFVAGDIDFAFGMFTPTGTGLAELDDEMPKFYALKADGASLALVGVPEVTLSADNVSVRINHGDDWPLGFGPPVIDFLKSFEDQAEAPTEDNDYDGLIGEPIGMQVDTGGEPIYFDFNGDQRFGGGADRVTMQLSEFVYATGSIYFEKGPLRTVQLTPGLLDVSVLDDVRDFLGVPDLDDTSLGNIVSLEKELNFLTIGAEGLNGFVGYDGPYWDYSLDANNNGLFDLNEINPAAVGIVLSDMDLGLAIMTPTNDLDPVRYIAAKASAQAIELVGLGDIDNGKGVTIAARGITFELNLSTPTALGFSLMPVVDFAATDFDGAGVGQGFRIRTAVNTPEPAECAVEPQPVGCGVVLDFDGPIIRVAAEMIEFDMIGVVTLYGSFAFIIGPIETVTVRSLLDPSSTSTHDVSTATIGIKNASAFIGWDGPYWSLADDEDGVFDPQTEANPDAVGFALTDVDAGIAIATDTSISAGAGGWMSLDLTATEFALVGLDFLSVSGTLGVTLNLGFGVSAGASAIDWLDSFPIDPADPGSVAGFAVDTGNIGQPVVLESTGFLIHVFLAGELTIKSNSNPSSAPIAALLGEFYFQVDGTAFQLFANANLRLGSDIGRSGDPLLAIDALGALYVDDTGFAADLAVSLSVNVGPLFSIDVSARAAINTTAATQSITLPIEIVDFLVEQDETNPFGLADYVLNEILSTCGDTRCYTIDGRAPRLILPEGTPDEFTIQTLLGFSTVGITRETTASAYVVVAIIGDFEFFDGLFTAEAIGAVRGSASTLELVVSLEFHIGGTSTGLSFEAVGALGIYDDGISLNASVDLRANLLSVIDLELEGSLLVNTRGSGTYFRLDLAGSLTMLSLIELSGGVIFEFDTTGAAGTPRWTITIPASNPLSADVFLFSLSASGTIDSTGYINLVLTGTANLTFYDTGLIGTIQLRACFDAQPGTGNSCTGGQEFSFGILASLGVWVLGHNIATVGVDTTVGGSLGDRVNIDISFSASGVIFEWVNAIVTVTRDVAEAAGYAIVNFLGTLGCTLASLIGLCDEWVEIERPVRKPVDLFRSGTIRLGSFQLPAVLVNDTPPPANKFLAEHIGSDLYLNVGDRAAGRGGIGLGEINEVYRIHTIDPGNLQGQGSTVIVTAFGIRQIFEGVYGTIIADFGDGNDQLIITGPALDAIIRGGSGDDEITYEGEWMVRLYGDGGNDILTVGVGARVNLALSLDGPVLVEGGTGNDTITVLANADSLLVGGLGDDTLFYDGADRAWFYGDDEVINATAGGNDHITIGSQTNADAYSYKLLIARGGFGNDILISDTSWYASALYGELGDDVLLGGPNDDYALEGGDGNDTIDGRGGNSNVDAGAGDDTYVIHTIDIVGSGSIDVGTGNNDVLVVDPDGLNDELFIEGTSSGAIYLQRNNPNAPGLYGYVFIYGVVPLRLDLGDGADIVHLRSSLVDSGLSSLDIDLGSDSRVDRIELDLTWGVGNHVSLSTAHVEAGEPGETVPVTIVSWFEGYLLTVSGSSAAHDVLTIEAGRWDDVINAGAVTDVLFETIVLIGGWGNDLIVGTPGKDFIDAGIDDDYVDGRGGTDTFTDQSGFDTLVTTSSTSFGLYGNALIIGDAETDLDSDGLRYVTGFVNAHITNTSDFENFELRGMGSTLNTFTVGAGEGYALTVNGADLATAAPWTGGTLSTFVGNVVLDGFRGSDLYYIEQAGISGAAIEIFENDRVLIALDINGNGIEDAGIDANNDGDFNDLGDTLPDEFLDGYNDGASDGLVVRGTSAADRWDFVQGTPREFSLPSGPYFLANTVVTLAIAGASASATSTLTVSDRFDTTLFGTRSGNDVVAVRGHNLYASPAFWVYGGSGDDLVLVGSNANATTQTNTGGILSMTGNVHVQGGSGTDTVVFDDTASTAGIAVDINFGLVFNGRNDINFQTQVFNVESMELNLGSGVDVIDIVSLPTSMVVRLGAGDDSITATMLLYTEPGGTEAVWPWFDGLLSIDGEADGATLIVQTASLQPTVGVLTATTIRGLGLVPSGIDYASIHTLTLRASTHADTLVVESTHAGTTTIDTRDGDDHVTIETVDGETVVYGGDGADTILVTPTLGDATTLTVDGGTGAADDGSADQIFIDLAVAGSPWITARGGAGDDVTINLTGAGSARIDVFGDTQVTVNGTAEVDDFLLRSGLVALIADTGSVEIVTFDATVHLVIHAGLGDDEFWLDDTSAVTELNGDDGRDSFVFGQLYGDDCAANPGLCFDPEHGAPTLIDTTDGQLTRGTSTATTANGGDGNDNFIVLSATAALTINGMDGNDHVTVRTMLTKDLAPVVRAPLVYIGGAAFDYLELVGSNSEDEFTLSGASIAGVTASEVEYGVVNGRAGDDTFLASNVLTSTAIEIYGGLGNDTFTATTGGSNGVIDAGIFFFGGEWDDGPALPWATVLPGEFASNPTETFLPGVLVDEFDSTDTLHVISFAPSGMSTFIDPQTIEGMGFTSGFNYLQLETVRLDHMVHDGEIAVVGTHGGETFISAGAGSAMITVFGVGGVTTIDAGVDDDEVLIFVSDAADGFLSELTILGGAGIDFVLFETGTDGLDDLVTVAPTTLEARGVDAAINYHGFATLVVLTGAGNDRVNVRGTSAETIISDNGGDDLFFVSDGADLGALPDAIATSGGSLAAVHEATLHGTLDPVLYDLFIDAGAGSNSVAISDRDNPLMGDWIIDEGAISGVSAGAIFFDASNGGDLAGLGAWTSTLGPDGSASGLYGHGVTIYTGTESDIIQIVGAPGGLGQGSSPPLTVTSIFAGDGDDLVIAGEYLAPDALVVVHLGQGDDIVVAGFEGIVAFGGEGNDLMMGGAGSDVLIGDRGTVILLATGAGLDITLGDSPGLLPDALAATSTMLGAHYPNDGDPRTIDIVLSLSTAGETADIILGGGGDDVIIGGSGDDDADGGIGNDVLVGDQAILTWNLLGTSPIARQLRDDTIFGAVRGPRHIDPRMGRLDWTITLLGHEVEADASSWGDDVLAGGAGSDYIFGGLGDDRLHGDGKRVDGTPGALAAADDVTTDADDYIEGNAGNDLIYGGLGQDSILGGSSKLFGLVLRSMRADGDDVIFGGNGDSVDRNTLGSTGHGRDADTIVGDNGMIYRLVGRSTGPSYRRNLPCYDDENEPAGSTRPRCSQLLFRYDDAYGDERIVARATKTSLDYSARGTIAVGGADIIHGEDGNDTIYGVTGNDVLFGDAHDDDIYGQAGADVIYGGTGDDGILGDDGTLHTNRNGSKERLQGVYGEVAETERELDGAATLLNPLGDLTKAANLARIHVGYNDIVFGGWGNDFIHGGDGDDALTGAEARAEWYADDVFDRLAAYFVDPTDVLAFGKQNDGYWIGWGATLEWVAAPHPGFEHFDPTAPGQRILIAPLGGGVAVDFLLNNDATENIANGGDGIDAIFGGAGRDWLVGGTNADRLYGGVGRDLLNADDDMSTNDGVNDAPDTAPAGLSNADIAFGGSGVDVLIANSADDRLIDFSSGITNFVVPFTAGRESVIRNTWSEELVGFVIDLAWVDGGDLTNGALAAGTEWRRYELHADADLDSQLGELGIATSQHGTLGHYHQP